MNILNTREIRQLTDSLTKQFGFKEKLDYVFIATENNNVYLLSKDLAKIDYTRLRVDKWGLYLGERKSDGIRLSIEGAQLVGKKAKKNVVDLAKEEVLAYFRGEDLDKECSVEGNPYVILKYHENPPKADFHDARNDPVSVHKNDVIGCAKYKEGRLLNYHPKIHRTNELIIK